MLPFIGELTERAGKATAYVCSNFACQVPTTDPDQLQTQRAALSHGGT